MGAIRNVSKQLNRIALILDGVLLFAMFGLVVVNVFLRKIFEINILWQYDLLRVLFVGFVFISASIVTYHDQHVRFVFFLDRMPSAMKRVESVLENVIFASFGGLVFYFGVRLTKNVANQKMPASGISAALLYVLMVLSMAVICLHSLVKILDAIANRRRATEESEGEAL